MTDEKQQTEQRAEHPKSRLFSILIFLAIVLAIAGGITLIARRSQEKALAKETEKLAIPTVAVFHPMVEPGSEDLVLPSTMQAYVESPIFARTSGYLKKWYFDIGSQVKKGDLLADIDSPEVDQQLMQAKSDLKTSKANEELSRITADRYQGLLKTDSVAKQDVDNAVGDYAAKKATSQSSEANVHRLEELASFEHVYAPFSGVVTKRNTDIGYLINAGNGGPVQELFDLAQTDLIRAFVMVPEPYSPSIHRDLAAYLELAQYPGQKFQGKVVRTADAIDRASRTLNTEADVPNKDGHLLPGGYAEVHLMVKVTGARLEVPVNALLFRSEGLRAAVVDQDHKIRLRTITVGRDYGTSLEVLSGLSADDWLVLNPADSLSEGLQVNVTQVPAGTLPSNTNAESSGANK